MSVPTATLERTVVSKSTNVIQTRVSTVNASTHLIRIHVSAMMDTPAPIVALTSMNASQIHA